MQTHWLFESVPNFSEGRRHEVIDSIASAAAGFAHVLDVSSDIDHNRSVVSLVAFEEPLLEGLVAAVAEARHRIDLRAHEGVHPRVGAADVVPIVPLGSATLGEAHVLARALGERIWTELQIPVYFYGHGEAHTLAAIRAGRAALDFGGPALHPTAGALCIGARSALVAFNVILSGAELTEARDLARSLRESGGGLPGVQALAFRLANGQVQLSMNLFRLSETHPTHVLAELARRGVSIVSQEIVGLCPAAAANSAAGGRLLEARLASAAARAAANRCRAIGDDEHVALASRLDGEAGELARLGATQDSFLAGAERAAALIEVLRAAQIFNPELEAMLDAAARGFRAAVSAETAAAFAARISALDARLR